MKKHNRLMLICCLVPIAIAGIFYYFGLKTYAILSLILLCPILHYFMMRDMSKKHTDKNEVEEKSKNQKKEKCH